MLYFLAYEVLIITDLVKPKLTSGASDCMDKSGPTEPLVSYEKKMYVNDHNKSVIITNM